MNIVAEIKQKLAKYPDLKLEKDRNSISVTPEGGFTVWATDHGGSYTVGFEGWHEEFSDPEEALDCFAWGLSNDCRLEIVSRNGKPHKWSAQHRSDGAWHNTSTTALVFFQFWRKSTVEYKQNAVIHS